jgi:hypothetical protein
MRVLELATLTAVVGCAAAGLAACAPPAGEATSAGRPNVSYAYTTDRELVDISRRAEAYCRTYGGWPRTTNVISRGDGTQAISYECDPVAPPATVATVAPVPAPLPLPARPTVAYSYRTDQELVDATRNAETQCRQMDARSRTTAINANVDGSRTVVFACERPL